MKLQLAKNLIKFVLEPLMLMVNGEARDAEIAATSLAPEHIFPRACWNFIATWVLVSMGSSMELINPSSLPFHSHWFIVA